MSYSKKCIIRYKSLLKLFLELSAKKRVSYAQSALKKIFLTILQALLEEVIYKKRLTDMSPIV